MSNLESKIRKLLESNKNKDPIKIEDDFNPEWLEYDSSQESTKDIANSISKNYNKASSTLLEEKDSVDIRLSTLERQITKVFAQFTGGAPDGSSVEQLIQLADVQVSYPVSDGQVLAYDANVGKWKANFGGSGGSINLTSVSQNIVPSTNETYDLGSSTNKWRDLYLSGSTLRLGDVEFKSTSEGDIEMKRAVTTAHGAAGERVKLKVKRMISDEAVDYNDLTNKPTGLATETYVDTKIADMVDSAPGALDTLNELAQSLGDDADFAGSVTNQLALKADITSVPVNVGDMSDVNLTGISSSQILQWDGTNWKPIDIPQGFDGDYNSLTNKPSLFDGDYNSLTNKPTLYADSDVDSHLNKSSATSGQILSWNGSDYAWVAESFDGDYNSLTNKPTLFDGDYNSLTNKPTIPSVVSDMSDVTITGSLLMGQHLTWTGSNWSNWYGYNDVSVDMHLNKSSATSSQILSWNGSDYDWIDQSEGVTTLSGLTDIQISAPSGGGGTPFIFDDQEPGTTDTALYANNNVSDNSSTFRYPGATNTGYIELTRATGGEKRCMYWDTHLPTDQEWYVNFEWKLSNPGGADDMRFIFWAPNAITSFEPATHGGYSIWFEFYHTDELRVQKPDESWIHNSSIGTSYSSNTWTPIQIYFDGTDQLTIDIDGTGLSNGTSYTQTVTLPSETLTGTYTGWTGRTGGMNSQQQIRNMRIASTPMPQAIALDRQYLGWNTTLSKWENKDFTISSLVDTDTTTHAPQANDVLTWTANNTWEPQQSSSSAQMVLADLANVDDTTSMVQSSNTAHIFDDMKPETPFTGTFYANGSVFTPPYQTLADFTTGGHETDQLVLYYDLGNTSSYSGSGTAINDISGSGIGGGGTIVGTNTTFQAAGIHPNSGAFKFNGGSQGDYIEIDKSNGFTLAADFSIEIWHRWDSSLPSTPFQGSMWTNSAEDDWSTGTGNDTGLLIGVDEIRYKDSNGTERQSNWTSTTTSPILNWHQIVFTVESGLGKIYIDGSYVLDLAYTLPDYSTQSNGVYALGITDKYNNSYRGEWNGLIGTTRVYHKALTAAQVLQNYNADADFYVPKSYPSRITTSGMSLNPHTDGFGVYGNGGHYAMLEHNVANRYTTVSWNTPLPHDLPWNVYFDLYIEYAGDGAETRFVFFAPNPISDGDPAVHGGMSLLLNYYSGDYIRFMDASDNSLGYNGTGFQSQREIPVWLSYDGNGNLSMELWRRGRVNNDPSSPDYNSLDGGTTYLETLTADISSYIGESGTQNGQPKINSTNNLYTGFTVDGWNTDSYTTAIEIKNFTSYTYVPPSISHGDIITWNTTGYNQGEWVKTSPTNWDTAYSWGDHSTENYLKNINTQSLTNMQSHWQAGSSYEKVEEDVVYKPVNIGNEYSFQPSTKPRYFHQFEDVEIESGITPISTNLICSLDFGNPACFPPAQLANTAQGGQNGATCFDLSGNGVDWTIQSFPGDRSAESNDNLRSGDVRVNPDKWGGVLEFTARSQLFADFLTCPGPDMNFGNEYTIEAWVQESRKDSRIFQQQNYQRTITNNFGNDGSTWFTLGSGWDGVDGSTFVGDWDEASGYHSSAPFQTGNDKRGLAMSNGRINYTSASLSSTDFDWTQYVKNLSRMGQADPFDPTGTSPLPGRPGYKGYDTPRNYTQNPVDSTVMLNKWYHYVLTVYQGWWMLYIDGIPNWGFPTSDMYFNQGNGSSTYYGNTESNINNGITWASVSGNNLDKWPQLIRAGSSSYLMPDYTNFTNGGYYGIGVGQRSTSSTSIWQPKFMGYIGNFRFYNKCLSLSEVMHNYRSESNRFRTYLNESSAVSPADRTVIQYDSSKSKWVGANPNQNMKNVTEALNDLGSIGNGTTDIDFSLANVVKATVNVSGIYATTFTFSNVPSTGVSSLTLILTDGGSQTVNWPASVTWGGGTAPTLTASGTDVLTFITTDGGTTFYGMTGGLNFS